MSTFIIQSFTVGVCVGWGSDLTSMGKLLSWSSLGLEVT